MKSIICPTLLLLAAGCTSTAPPATRAPAPPGPASLPTLSKSDPVYAYVDSMRGDLSRGKVDSINALMQLDAAESNVFWPIYHDYEAELFELGDQRLEIIRQFLDAQESRTLDNKRAADLSDAYFRFEAARLELTRKYHGIVARALSPLRAAQFAQVEHRVGTVIDLLIASELPLVRPAAADAAAGQ